MLKTTLSRRSRITSFVVLVLMGAGVGMGVALSSSSSGPAIYIPPAKQAVHHGTWPPPNAAPPAPRNLSAVSAASASALQPPPNAGQIVLASTTPLEVPSSTDVLTPTSGWADLRGNSMVEIFAGSSARDPATGVIFVAADDQTTGQEVDPSGVYTAPTGSGALTLTAVSGQTVSFVTNDGTQGTFDLGTKVFKIGG